MNNEGFILLVSESHKRDNRRQMKSYKNVCFPTIYVTPYLQKAGH